MKRALAALLCAMGFLCMSAVCAMTGLEHVFLDPSRYTAIQDRLDVYPSVGISREEQILINGDLAAYLAGKTDSLAREVTLLGERVDCAFNERELTHMKDVRRLFERGFALRRLLLAVTVVFMAAPFVLREGRMWKAGLLLSAILFVAAGLTAFVLLRTADFNRLFIRFHQLVFTNDLWLLDPQTDAMIRMLPDGFFEPMALSGGLWALFGALVPFAAGGGLALIHPQKTVFSRVCGRKRDPK